MKETDIDRFWNTNPCGETISGADMSDGFQDFFRQYDEFRYRMEPHILTCLDEIPWRGKRVLEIGLGQGADSEQLIKRGAIWNGIDLTETAARRTRSRLTGRGLPHQICRSSALAIPYASGTFDIVYSHGVLHHIPDIDSAQREIARVLKPGTGTLIAMLYAKFSLNYFVILTLRRAALLTCHVAGIAPMEMVRKHMERGREIGMWNYLKATNFISANTDGPENPYSRVYSTGDVVKTFTEFELIRTHKHHLHAPPLPVQHLPGGSALGWHLWVHLRKK
jgi:ubiquinone/menaquinone biosynthesis C-methylase UbiE